MHIFKRNFGSPVLAGLIKVSSFHYQNHHRFQPLSPGETDAATNTPRSLSQIPFSTWMGYCYPLNADINAVQDLVEWGSDTLSGGDGTLWTLLLHICEETLLIWKILDFFAVICGNVQPELLPAQDTLHPSELAGGRCHVCRRRSSLLPSECSAPELHSITGILHFDQNNLSVIHQKKPLQREMTALPNAFIYFDWHVLTQV